MPESLVYLSPCIPVFLRFKQWRLSESSIHIRYFARPTGQTVLLLKRAFEAYRALAKPEQRKCYSW